ncbi:MAG: MBL fold metallo-hydrolase [Euryarchaeota archaeon]|nr:MBL fold metallo-hydrolase [Euryarchaeota archaeon]
MTIEITFIGTGVAMPQPHRVQSGILANLDSPVLFDCGSGVLPRLLDYASIEHVFLTHLHLDHVADVMSLIKAKWLCGSHNLRIYGPSGTKEWLSRVFDAYPYMIGKMNVEVFEMVDQDRIPIGRYEIVCARTAHGMPSLGYGIADKGGRVRVVYSGDTEPIESIAALASGADLLIHECSFPDSVPDVTNHTTPRMLGDMMVGVAVGRIILTHLYPHTIGFEEEMVATLHEYCGCDVTIGQDMETVVLDSA